MDMQNKIPAAPGMFRSGLAPAAAVFLGMGALLGFGSVLYLLDPGYLTALTEKILISGIRTRSALSTWTAVHIIVSLICAFCPALVVFGMIRAFRGQAAKGMNFLSNAAHGLLIFLRILGWILAAVFFKKVMEGCGIPCLDEESLAYARHPLSYMMEAADDICYLILDMEDAHKRGIVRTETIDAFFTSFFKENETWFFNRKDEIYETVTDNNERMSFLRATAINKLVDCVSTVFINNYDAIMNGSFKNSLVHHLPEFENDALEKCREFSLKNIYKHPSVVKVELTGFNVIGELLDEFVQAAVHPEKTYNKKLLSIIPEQFKNNKEDTYSRIQVALDYISNMTDLYAVQLYKDLKGV